LVGFAAESGNLIKNAEDKLRRKQVDAIVANDISQEGIGIGADENEVTLLFPGQPPQPLPRASKGEVARQLLRVIHDRLLKLPSERIQQPITTP
jgi:phosphopantothenoylcysteine decarboxylase/phosphopantothenate--cysteine ligase